MEQRAEILSIPMNELSVVLRPSLRRLRIPDTTMAIDAKESFERCSLGIMLSDPTFGATPDGMQVPIRTAMMLSAPTVVCLCGSTRFWKEFQRASLRETMKGRIVLSIGAASGTDDEHFGNLSKEEYAAVKQMLDELHKRKIDMCDQVLILNVDGYVGESTRSEWQYALALGKQIRWLEPDKAIR
jgi:hypothetical protein